MRVPLQMEDVIFKACLDCEIFVFQYIIIFVDLLLSQIFDEISYQCSFFVSIPLRCILGHFHPRYFGNCRVNFIPVIHLHCLNGRFYIYKVYKDLKYPPPVSYRDN